MKMLHRLSAAFLLLDGYTKLPILGASILVDGKRVPHVRKGDGHYIFSNLLPVAHVYEITVPGYRTVSRTVPVCQEEAPDVIVMQYDRMHPRLGQVPHIRFSLRHQEKPVADATVRLTLCTHIGALRVVEKGAKGAQSITLSRNYTPMMLYQNYALKTLDQELILVSYDQVTGQYELKDPLSAVIKSGTLLCPVWELQTDREGGIIFPVQGLFAQREEMEWLIQCDTLEAKVCTPIPNGRLDVVVTL